MKRLTITLLTLLMSMGAWSDYGGDPEENKIKLLRDNVCEKCN